MSDSLTGKSPERPVLIFDGESRVCPATADRWREASGGRIRFAAYQEAAAEFHNIAADDVRRAVHFVDADGKVTSGASGSPRGAHCRRRRWLLWSYQRLPPVAFVADEVYRLVAASRGAQTIVRRIWWGKDLKPPTYHIASTLFLRLLGVVYLIAFISLWTQIDGLIGDHGILPVNQLTSRRSSSISPSKVRPSRRSGTCPRWRGSALTMAFCICFAGQELCFPSC